MFLNRISVPYLIVEPTPPTSALIKLNSKRIFSESLIIDEYQVQRQKITKLVEDLSPFMKIGTCHNPKKAIGWDVLFNIEFDGKQGIRLY